MENKNKEQGRKDKFILVGSATAKIERTNRQRATGPWELVQPLTAVCTYSEEYNNYGKSEDRKLSLEERVSI